MRIREILAQNTRHRLDDPVPMEADIAKAEATLGVPSFPNDYRQFVLLGGLNDLRFTCRTWAPDQVARASSSGPPKDLLPFADDGTGNLYCWKRNRATRFPDLPLGSRYSAGCLLGRVVCGVPRGLEVLASCRHVSLGVPGSKHPFSESQAVPKHTMSHKSLFGLLLSCQVVPSLANSFHSSNFYAARPNESLQRTATAAASHPPTQRR